MNNYLEAVMVHLQNSHKRFKLTALLTIVLLFNLVIPAGQPVKAVAMPTSCQDIRSSANQSIDGHYTIYHNNKPFEVYCKDMDGVPVEYLSLAATGAGYNFSTYAPSSAISGPGIVTTFTKLRINPATLVIDSDDYAYSSSTGTVFHYVWRTQIPYGVARSCTGNETPTGTANIDLTGTPFALLTNQFSLGGNGPKGTTTYSSDNQIVQLTGDGYCGWNAPTLADYDAPGGNLLQLTLLSQVETPPSLPAPVYSSYSSVAGVLGSRQAVITIVLKDTWPYKH